MRWWLDPAATGYQVALEMVKYMTPPVEYCPAIQIARSVAATSIDINAYLDVVQLAV